MAICVYTHKCLIEVVDIWQMWFDCGLAQGIDFYSNVVVKLCGQRYKRLIGVFGPGTSLTPNRRQPITWANYDPAT